MEYSKMSKTELTAAIRDAKNKLREGTFAASHSRAKDAKAQMKLRRDVARMMTAYNK